MPARAIHEAAAKANSRTLLYLGQNVSAHPQWVSTVAFYTAVQIAEAVFDEKDGGHSDDHKDRNRRLEKTHSYKELWKHFFPLYSCSRVARYLQHFQTGDTISDYSAFVSNDKVVSQLLRQNLCRFISSAQILIGDGSFLEAERNQILTIKV